MRPPRPNGYRDTWCGSPQAGGAGRPARVAGWVHRRRDHGGLVFIDLRDRSGLLQLVFHPDRAPDAHARAHELRAEDVISASGTIARRAPENVNPGISTGEVELEVEDVELLADSDTPPFPIDEERDVDELVRMRHRPLDLRRPRQRDTLVLRHRAAQTIRRTLDDLDFVEIETPILTRSTPEGARDFLVPARAQRGSFYALPQSPQLFKQLLMVAGFERYFQIVRCFRDEDPRADRQPEFTQLDLEMSFVDEDDVIEVVETVMARVFEAGEFEAPAPPWPRERFDDLVARYGTDRPDRRFGMEIHDVGDAVAGSQLQVFARALADGGAVRAINAGARELPRSELDSLVETAQRLGAKGLVWAFVEDGGGWRSPVARFMTPEEMAAVADRLDAGPGDLLLAVADDPAVASGVLGALRLDLADRLGLVSEARHDPLWVVDFPMFAWNRDEERWDALHHPFTQPVGSLDDPASLRSRAYDLVLDGFEIGGGSIRTHRLDVQRRVFELVGIGAEEAQQRFGFLLDALRYGAPPHGGIALGLDRMVAMMAGWRTAREVNIRESISFPKTATGQDPLTGAPAPVDPAQLRELGLRVERPPGSAA